MEHRLGILINICLGFAIISGAQESIPARSLESPAADLPIKEIGRGVFELGTIRFDKKQKSLSFPAAVNMGKELIEYLVVSSSGKLHESLLRTESEPYHIHLAMLLLGAKGPPEKASSPSAGAVTNQPPWIDSSSLKNSPPLKGDAISIWLSWATGGKENRCRAEDWIFNKKTNSQMPPGNWIYTGSMVVNGTFIAQRDRSIAAIITDPFALINNPRRGHDDDQIWHVNAPVVPPEGTAILVTIKLE